MNDLEPHEVLQDERDTRVQKMSDSLHHEGVVAIYLRGRLPLRRVNPIWSFYRHVSILMRT